MDNPLLLQERGKFLSLAREKVHADGYQYKKKKSRSKSFGSGNLAEYSQVTKTPRLTQELRDKRMAEIKEDLAELDTRLMYLERSREKFVAVRQYERASEKSKELSSSIRSEKRELMSELSQMQKLEEKSQKYFKSKKSSVTDQDALKIADQVSSEDPAQCKLQSFFKVTTPNVTPAPIEVEDVDVVIPTNEESNSDNDNFLLINQTQKTKQKN